MQPFVCGILIWLSPTGSGYFTITFCGERTLSKISRSKFHLYVCAAFLKRWKSELEQKKDFQGILLFIQVMVLIFSWSELSHYIYSILSLSMILCFIECAHR